MQPIAPGKDPADYEPAKPELEHLANDVASKLENHLTLGYDLSVVDDTITAHVPFMLGGFVPDSSSLVLVVAFGVHT